jgi:hypothetical protein
MKGFHCDLMLMDRDLENGLFACFLHISMPPSWNYVFAGLPQMYTSAEVEHRIKDEHSIKANQESVTMAFHATQTNAKGHKHSHNLVIPTVQIVANWDTGLADAGLKVVEPKEKDHTKRRDKIKRRMMRWRGRTKRKGMTE